jgi:hypothetical protein
MKEGPLLKAHGQLFVDPELGQGGSIASTHGFVNRIQMFGNNAWCRGLFPVGLLFPRARICSPV